MRIGLRRKKPSATLQPNVAHGLGPTVIPARRSSPPGGSSTEAGFFMSGAGGIRDFETLSQNRRAMLPADIRPVKSPLSESRIRPTQLYFFDANSSPKSSFSVLRPATIVRPQ